MTLTRRKLVIPLAAKSVENASFTQLRYAPGTRLLDGVESPKLQLRG